VGLAPPENKTSNLKTGRPRPIPTISAICLVNYIYILQFILRNIHILVQAAYNIIEKCRKKIPNLTNFLKSSIIKKVALRRDL